MAKLADYGVLDYEDIADYKIPVETIDTMLGLLAFPIVEETILNDGIQINVYEKSFWGRKHKGYISLRHIDDVQADISKFDYDDGTPVPEKSEILIGLDFMCAYERYNVPSHAKIYDLGKPRKQILSYGVVMHNLNIKGDTWHELLTEQIRSTDVFSFTPISPLYTTMIGCFNEIKKKFSVFEKYVTVE